MYTAVNSHTDESLPHFPLRDTSLVISPTFRQKPLSNSRAALFILLIRPAWKYVFSIWPRSFYIIRGRVRAISFRPVMLSRGCTSEVVQTLVISLIKNFTSLPCVEKEG